MKYLLPTIMEAYGDVEKTGSATQYYDKFKYRYYMSATFHYMLSHKNYLNQLDVLPSSSLSTFLKFAHFLMAEINNQFEEAILSVKKMRELEQQEESGEVNSNDLSEEEQQN